MYHFNMSIYFVCIQARIDSLTPSLKNNNNGNKNLILCVTWICLKIVDADRFLWITEVRPCFDFME